MIPNRDKSIAYEVLITIMVIGLIRIATLMGGDERITEDDPRFNCHTMGNLICGNPHSHPGEDGMYYLPPGPADEAVATGEVIATTTPTTVSTLPGGSDAPSHPKLGWFRSGWDYQYPTGIRFAQTYVHACSSALPHRLSMMNGNAAFVYVETQEPIEDTISGALDECWLNIIRQLPSGAVFAPIAEANGWWTPYNGTVEQVRQAYERIAMLDGGKHVMCGSFTVMSGANAYLAAVKPYVQRACPSHYTKGGSSGATIAAQARAHGASAGLVTILAQTGTEGADKRAFIENLMANVGSLRAVIYFDTSRWEGDWTR